MDRLDREEGAAPVYRRVADRIIREIGEGKRQPGDRLPTVRSLAEETGLSLGTAKHVYDVLEREGYLVKEQGRGTFVRALPEAPAGGKDRAMEAIDRLLDEMRALSFSWQETRIFFDLKLREREQEQQTLRIAAVDCSPEALAMMKEQVLALPHVEVDGYLLDPVLESPRPFDPPADLVVTTATHGADLEKKLRAGQTPIRLVMALGAETAVELAAIPAGTRVGIICKSPRFAGIILSACEKYCRLEHPIQVAYLGSPEDVARVAEACGLLILPPNHRLFSSRREEEILIGREGTPPHILYWYQVERGSMVYLENQVRSMLQAKQG